METYLVLHCVENNLIEPETVLSRLHCVSLLYKATMEAESRFASLNAQDFEDLVANKDCENTTKPTKVAVELFRRYLAVTTICCFRIKLF